MKKSDSEKIHGFPIIHLLIGCGVLFLIALTIISISEIDSIRSDIHMFKLILAIVLIVLMIATYITMSYMIHKRVRRLTEQAEMIAVSSDYSTELDADGPFRELNVLSDAYNRLFSQINHSLQKQKRFNHDVSHELKTPLAVLKAQIQLSKEQFADQPESMQNITLIERQINRMDKLVQRLLELSRLEQEHIFDHTEMVDLTAVVESICEDISFLHDRDNLFSLSLEPVEITANNGLIFTMLRNLIENAVKYSPADTPVEITTYRTEEDARVRIRDHGIGMSGEVKEHVFDLFYRAEEARSTEGFGLGIPLADRIAKIYHGRIEVESEEGKGSLFTVILPASKNN